MPGLFDGIDDEDPLLHCGLKDLLKSPDLGASLLVSNVTCYVEKMIWEYQTQLVDELREMNVELDHPIPGRRVSWLVQRPPARVSERSHVDKRSSEKSHGDKSVGSRVSRSITWEDKVLPSVDETSTLEVKDKRRPPALDVGSNASIGTRSRLSWIPSLASRASKNTHHTCSIANTNSVANSSPKGLAPHFLITQEEAELQRKLSQERMRLKRSKQTDARELEIVRAEYFGRMSMLKRIVTSNNYERCLCLFILSNAVFMGIEIGNMTGRQSTEALDLFTQAEIVYCSLFTLELSLRIFVHGMIFFTSPVDRGWNLFEVVIIVISILQTLSKILFKGERSHMQPLQVLRSVRVLRILRLVVSLRGLRPLRLLVHSIISTLGSCFWILLLLAFIMYMFGLAFTNAALLHLYDCDDCTPDPEVLHFFGTLPDTLVTLFQSICGGVSWREPMLALGNMNPTGGLYIIVFIMYITFTYFAVLNVVTALFCQHAVENSLADQDVLLEKKQEGLFKISQRLEKLFNRLDDVGSTEERDGKVTFGDLHKLMGDEEVANDFALLGLEPADAWTLFKLIDGNSDGHIEMTEFVQGCIKLRGGATKMDMHLLLYENKYLFSKLDGFMHFVFKELTELKGHFGESAKHPLKTQGPDLSHSHHIHSAYPSSTKGSDRSGPSLLSSGTFSAGCASPVGSASPPQPSSPRSHTALTWPPTKTLTSLSLLEESSNDGDMARPNTRLEEL